MITEKGSKKLTGKCPLAQMTNLKINNYLNALTMKLCRQNEAVLTNHQSFTDIQKRYPKCDIRKIELRNPIIFEHQMKSSVNSCSQPPKTIFLKS